MIRRGDVTFRVSPEAQAGLQEPELTRGQIMEAFERAAREANMSVHEWAMRNSMLTFSAHDKVANAAVICWAIMYPGAMTTSNKLVRSAAKPRSIVVTIPRQSRGL